MLHGLALRVEGQAHTGPVETHIVSNDVRICHRLEIAARLLHVDANSVDIVALDRVHVGIL